MVMIVITELSGKRMAGYQEISVKVISKQSQQSFFFHIIDLFMHITKTLILSRVSHIQSYRMAICSPGSFLFLISTA